MKVNATLEQAFEHVLRGVVAFQRLEGPLMRRATHVLVNTIHGLTHDGVLARPA